MKKSYAHLTLEQRCLIKSLREIREEIKVDASTIVGSLKGIGELMEYITQTPTMYKKSTA